MRLLALLAFVGQLCFYLVIEVLGLTISLTMKKTVLIGSEIAIDFLK